MLYVFLVDTGAMLTFEMELAMESVETLMISIASTLMIPIGKQVLLMEGGETLDRSHRICNYSSAGTESSPIFLFSKRSIESPVPPSPSLNLGSETSLKEEVESSLKLPPTYETLVSRTHLAMRFQNMASELSQSCVSLVREQTLQRQGWLAVIANLENIASTFQKKGTILEQTYSEFLEVIPQYQSLLDNFSKVILLLSKIPVFACLIQNDIKIVLSKEKDVTLLDWINAQDKRNSLEDMVQQCQENLEQIGIQNMSLIEKRGDREQVLDDVSNKNMKEIGGLEERLNMLLKLCENAGTLAQEQSDMAQGFSQNQIRAQNIGDPSVLPDLCSSHRKQLSLLMNNHSQLRDIRRRCTKAKDELSGNLHARLRWVMMIEKKICDCDHKLVLYHENMKLVKTRVEILQQINLAPRIYALTVKEVVRRRDVAAHFMKWATSVSHKSAEIYKEEVARRQQFSQFVGNHFLQSLFTGIDNMPTPFADTAPVVLDVGLPALTLKELKELLTKVPELLAERTEADDVGNYLSNQKTGSTSIKMKSLSSGDLPTIRQYVVVDSSGEALHSRGDGSKTNYVGKESDTSCRGLENVQTKESDEIDFLSFKSKKTEENSGASTESCGRTKILYDETNTEQQDTSSKIISSNLLVKENVEVNIRKMRDELQQLALAATSWKKNVDKYLSQRTRLFEQFKKTKTMGSLNAENRSLRKELKTKDETFSETVTRYRTELEKQKQFASELESGKEKFEAEQQIRFNSAITKLMKEKDISLKKAYDELAECENLQKKNEEKLQVLFNEKEGLRHEKEQSVKKLADALAEFTNREKELENCAEEIRKSLEEKEMQFAEQLENEKKGAAAMIVRYEKQKSEDSSGSGKIISELVVERFRKRINNLEEENKLLKDQLTSRADGDDKILFVELQKSLDEKCKECDSLRKELEHLHEMPRTRSPQAVSKDFQKGDIVDVFYNEQYGLYMIRATGEMLYFVHPDSLVNLDIPPEESKPSGTFQAQVLDKEYCQAKKANNRFKVAVGAKFYRVKVRSFQKDSQK